MGAGKAELVGKIPAAWLLAWGGERSPVGLKVECGVDAIELGAPLALCGRAIYLHQIEVLQSRWLGPAGAIGWLWRGDRVVRRTGSPETGA